MKQCLNNIVTPVEPDDAEELRHQYTDPRRESTPQPPLMVLKVLARVSDPARGWYDYEGKGAVTRLSEGLWAAWS
jgi:hypothetical protein